MWDKLSGAACCRGPPLQSGFLRKFRLEEKQLNNDNPKRRKAKDNPYTIRYCKETGTYSIFFKDGQGVSHSFEIDNALYDIFDGFELEDLSALNEFDRHTEHSELTEATLNKRALEKPRTVEEIVYENLRSEQLYSAISELPDTQRRRLLLYYFGGLTYGQIAEMEECSHVSVIHSIDKAKAMIKEKLKFLK